MYRSSLHPAAGCLSLRWRGAGKRRVCTPSLFLRAVAPGGFRCAASSADLAEDASSALHATAAAIYRRNAAASRDAGDCARRFLSAHGCLQPRERASWWAQQALEEEDRQLDELSRALPRGGRIAPQLLDTFAPVSNGVVETVFKNLVGVLGGPAGLLGALRLRASVRISAAMLGPDTQAGLALHRLDRKLQAVLALWFSAGLVRVQAMRADASATSLSAAAAVARDAAPDLPIPDVASEEHWYRCFSLSHPMLRESDSGDCAEAIPLLVAHVSVLSSNPRSMSEAVNPSADARNRASSEAGGIACIWALGATSSGATEGLVVGEALRGLGLGQLLRREASRLLREESQGVVIRALVPMRGIAAGLHATRAWETARARGLDEALVEASKRAMQGLATRAAVGEEVRFVDADGDSVLFRVTKTDDARALSLQVSLGDSEPRRVSRLLLVDGGKALRFLMQPRAEAMQVNAPEEVAAKGDLVRVREMAEACGLLPPQAREAVARLAYEQFMRQAHSGLRVIDPVAHFHLLGGAALTGLSWDADESARGLSQSFGLMANFVYESPELEEARAAAYAEFGDVATTDAQQAAS